MKKKGLSSPPVFFPGRFYLAGCVTCDGAKFKAFCNLLYSTLYPTEAEQKEHVTLCSAKMADNHRYTFVSVPMGDTPLVQALIDTELDGDFLNGYEKQNNVFRLCFGAKVIHPCVTALELWNSGQFAKCTSFLRPFHKVNPFCLFLSIRAQLVSWDLAQFANAVRDVNEYIDYHEKVSGRDSEQYGNAILLEALVYQKLGTNAAAKDKLLMALPRLKALKGYACYVLGALCEGEEAYSYLKQTDMHRFSGIAQKYYQCNRLAYASHFATKRFEDNPMDPKLAQLMACIHCKLENSHISRRIWASLGLTVDQMDRQEQLIPESIERICAKCEKPGNSLFFLRCPTCLDWWYCSQTCIEADAADHRPFCQWCSHCNVLIPLGQREWCTGCFDVFYCGRDCQLEHWRKGHNKICNKRKK